jgi:AraC family transcriptional regulator of adaptative response / methylphosphotriester-DNA alkyltransferase methyltransferase
MARPEEIVRDYRELIDRHLEALVNGKAERMYEIEDFARALHIHPTHLTNTVVALEGTSACGLYQPLILATAKRLLDDRGVSIRAVALTLDFDPAQFTRWFKKLAGMTPKQYRANTEIKSIL